MSTLSQFFNTGGGSGSSIRGTTLCIMNTTGSFSIPNTIEKVAYGAIGGGGGGNRKGCSLLPFYGGGGGGFAYKEAELTCSVSFNVCAIIGAGGTCNSNGGTTSITGLSSGNICATGGSGGTNGAGGAGGQGFGGDINNCGGGGGDRGGGGGAGGLLGRGGNGGCGGGGYGSGGGGALCAEPGAPELGMLIGNDGLYSLSSSTVPVTDTTCKIVYDCAPPPTLFTKYGDYSQARSFFGVANGASNCSSLTPYPGGGGYFGDGAFGGGGALSCCGGCGGGGGGGGSTAGLGGNGIAMIEYWEK